ncbi:MAG: ATP-binding protein [Bacteroidales bacterium]|nr:ATP-binding protein [Bacteroidales bacterium]
MKNQLVINSKIEELRKVEKFVDEISSTCKLNSELYGNLLIAVLEGANNAIVHGNKLKEELPVTLEAEYDDKLLKITIKDCGKGFDYNNVPDPTAPENIENVSGRGIFLMRKLSDNTEFYDNGSKVVLTFNL